MGRPLRLLLDTHALAWWFQDSDRLGRDARERIADEDNVVMVSVVSAFEMATKHRLGKWPEVAPLLQGFAMYLHDERFEILPLSLEHAQLAGRLDIPHRDPFDRLLIAQAQVEQALFVSNEALFDRFKVSRLW